MVVSVVRFGGTTTMPRDLAHRIAEQVLKNPSATIATFTGTGVDLSGFESAACLFQVGAWTDGTHTPKLQDSPDNSTWADVTAGNLIGSFTAVSGAGQQNAIQEVGYIGSQRWLRLVVTVAGATTGAVYGAAVVQGNARNLPA